MNAPFPPARGKLRVNISERNGGIVKLTEIKCKTLLTPSAIRGCDLAANPYAGCEHACAYCYAKFMKPHTFRDEVWGEYVDVRVNAAEAAIDQLCTGKFSGRSVFIGTITDPYQPAEKHYRLMRELLPVMNQFGMAVSILTKSGLVSRDIDIIKDMKKVSVGLTITGIDERAREAFEPGAPPYAERLVALEKLSGAGVDTFAFIAPILPGITDRDFDILLRWIKDSGAKEIMFDSLNYSEKNQDALLEGARKACPGSTKEYVEYPVRAARTLRGRVKSFEKESDVKCSVFF